MPNGQSVTVTCNGAELPWSFEFGSAMTKTGTSPREDIHVTVDGADPSFVIKETIGPSIINVRGITEAGFAARAARHSDRLAEDTADRRRDDNLREMFGG